MTDTVKEMIKNIYLDKCNFPDDYKIEQDLSPTASDEEAFENLQKIKENIVDWVHGGYNLYISSSNCGNGKTSWATKLGLAYINSFDCKYSTDTPVFLINSSEYSSLLKTAINNPADNEKLVRFNKAIDEAEIVIWDDFGNTASSSTYVYDFVYAKLNQRFASNKSNIFTSNIPLADLDKYMSTRLADRIGGYSDEIKFVGHSRRNKRFF